MRERSMRQLRHLSRLRHDGVSAREIGRRLGVARSTIQDNLKRAAAAGLAWPLTDDVPDEALETRLYGRAGVTQGQRWRAEPDWAALARELERRLTLVMRQHHVAGEETFVDYTGKRIEIADPTEGSDPRGGDFVGVLGASNLTHAEAT